MDVVLFVAGGFIVSCVPLHFFIFPYVMENFYAQEEAARIGRSGVLWESLLCTRKIFIKFESLEQEGKFCEEGSKWLQEVFKDFSDKWNFQKGNIKEVSFPYGLGNSKTINTYWRILIGEVPAVWLVRCQSRSLDCPACSLLYRIYLTAGWNCHWEFLFLLSTEKILSCICTLFVLLLWTTLHSVLESACPSCQS